MIPAPSSSPLLRKAGVSLKLALNRALNDPPYGTERSFNGLRLAKALPGKGAEVTVFLMADAVACANARFWPALPLSAGVEALRAALDPWQVLYKTPRIRLECKAASRALSEHDSADACCAGRDVRAPPRELRRPPATPHPRHRRRVRPLPVRDRRAAARQPRAVPGRVAAPRPELRRDGVVRVLGTPRAVTAFKT